MHFQAIMKLDMKLERHNLTSSRISSHHRFDVMSLLWYFIWRKLHEAATKEFESQVQEPSPP